MAILKVIRPPKFPRLISRRSKEEREKPTEGWAQKPQEGWKQNG